MTVVIVPDEAAVGLTWSTAADWSVRVFVMFALHHAVMSVSSAKMAQEKWSSMDRGARAMWGSNFVCLLSSGLVTCYYLHACWVLGGDVSPRWHHSTWTSTAGLTTHFF